MLVIGISEAVVERSFTTLSRAQAPIAVENTRSAMAMVMRESRW